MACKLDITSDELVEWSIDSNEKIMESLFDDYEYAGSFAIHITEENTCDSTGCSVKRVKQPRMNVLNKGDSSSVKTVDGYCNFHTHPLSCYVQENCVWGWPSGEDMRECVGFSLRNNLFHIVFALEGAYLIQLNPNILAVLMDSKKLAKAAIPSMDNKRKNMSPDRIRGAAVSLIEMYFKATHGHRTIDYNVSRGHEPAGPHEPGTCMPDDWVRFANAFRLENARGDTNMSCGKMLPCSGIPDYEAKGRQSVPVEQYILSYGDLEGYSMSSRGVMRDVPNQAKFSNHTMSSLDALCRFFSSIPTTMSYGDETWLPGQWFNCKLFHNSFQLLNNNMVPRGPFLPFHQWIDRLCREGTFLPLVVAEHWKAYAAAKSGFAFDEIPSVMFKPFKPPGTASTCSLVDGSGVHDWVKHRHRNKH